MHFIKREPSVPFCLYMWEEFITCVFITKSQKTTQKIVPSTKRYIPTKLIEIAVNRQTLVTGIIGSNGEIWKSFFHTTRLERLIQRRLIRIPT